MYINLYISYGPYYGIQSILYYFILYIMCYICMHDIYMYIYINIEQLSACKFIFMYICLYIYI